VTPFELTGPGKNRDAPGPTTARGRARAAVEVPTLLLIASTYGGWLFITSTYGHWPLWVVAPITAVVLTLHSSLQHEIVHGHPTRWVAFNRLFGLVPLSFWMPYERYHQQHRVHHIDARLTDPLDDPESFYWTHEAWSRLSRFTQLMVRAQQTLAGRVIIGSFWHIGAFLHSEARRLLRDEPGVRKDWLEHLVWCVPVIVWVKLVCGIPLWLYLVAMVIPGNGIVLIRSFAEHRARAGVPERVAVVENSWILGPLFLFNNLHSLHHETPPTPWYQLPRHYRVHRERLIAANGGLVYCTYFDVARRYMFRAHDVIEHPTGRVPLTAA
jgi:fatty acid desaturase